MKTIILLFLVCAALPAHADLVKMPLEMLDHDCLGPAVASDPHGLTMVGYTARGVLLMDFIVVQPMGTRAECADYVGEPVTLGAGSSVKICWTREGFVAAVISSPMILVYASDLEGNWDTANPTMIPAAGEVVGLDLWGTPSDAAGPHVFMTWQTWENPPTGDYGVYYASAGAYGWSAAEPVALGLPEPPHPRITWGVGPAGPWPNIYYLAGTVVDRQLIHTTKDLAAGWSTPVVVPDAPFDGVFDVVKNWYGEHDILGLGPQPVCPCGSIHLQTYDDGWLPAEDVTADHLEYDWPFSPNLARDDQGKTYAFWTQLASGPDLDPRFRTLEYRIRSGDVWDDQSALFLDQNGPRLGGSVAIDVNAAGHPVMAWTRRDTIEGVPQNEQVWVARAKGATPVGEMPAANATLSAWPNPFNPLVKLAVDARAGEHARLDIHDARGHLVRTLLDEVLTVDRREVAWDGIDRNNHAAPSGVYFARLVYGGQASQVTKLVLAR